MDWEQVLMDFSVVAGFMAFIIFWLGLAMWMRVDADKRGMTGWVWIFIGLLTGPLGLIFYLFYRGSHPVLPVVRQRDELIAETARTHTPIDYNPELSSGIPLRSAQPTESESLKAALEAEERRYKKT